MFILSIFLAVIGIVLLLTSKLYDDEESGLIITHIISGWAINVIAVVFFIFSMFYTINPGQVGIEILFGKVVEYAPSGLNVKNPLAKIVKMDLRTIKYEAELESASKDLQEIKVNIAINYRIDYERIKDLYNKVGIDYELKVINPAVMNLSKAAVSNFPITDIIVKRNELSELIFNSLKDRLYQYYIILETVNLNNISFAEAFSKAVEEKQVQEQKVQTAEYKKQEAEKTAEQTIISAKAEAEVTRLNAVAESEKQRLLRNTASSEVIELKWIERWDGKLPTYMFGDKTIPMINLNKE